MPDWPHLAAGVMTVILGAAHGAIGERTFLRRMRAGDLSRADKRTLRLVWHLFTIAMLTTGALLISSGLMASSVLAGRVLATLLAAWGLLFALYLAAIDPRLLLRVPQPALLFIAAALAWFGGSR